MLLPTSVSDYANIATALFAGFGAWAIWQTRREAVTVQFRYGFAPPMTGGENPWSPPAEATDGPLWLSISATVTNKSAHRIVVNGWEIDGLPLCGPNSTGVDTGIAIGDQGVFSITLLPDWRSWAERSSGIFKPKARASLIIDCNTRIYATRSFTAKLTTIPETSNETAAKVRNQS